MRRTIVRYAAGLLILFVVSMVYTAYWGLIRQDDLLARDDNPRRVLEASQIVRGAIVDRNGRVLAESVILPDGTAERRYPVPEVAPVVGYYSLRFGESGVEDAFNDVLTGEAYRSPGERLRDDLVNRPPVGGDLQLTLDRAVQEEVENLFAPGQRGAIVVMEADTGAILALASRPSFDPNTLDDNFDRLRDNPAAPLLNRATQSLYQPGTALQYVVYGATLNYNTFDLGLEWEGARTARIDNSLLSCTGTPSEALTTVAKLALWSCPGPLLTAQQSLENRFLINTFADYGLFDTPQLPIEVAEPTFDPAAPLDARLLALGQSDLTVSPLQMALVAAAFSNNGRMPAPQLIEAVRPPREAWQPQEALSVPRGTISPTANEQIVALMQEAVTNGAAQNASLPGRQVYGQTGLAVSGLNDSFTVWFLGFAYNDDGHPIAVAVVIEDERDGQLVSALGSAALRAALR